MSNDYRVVVGAKLNGILCYFDLDICTERAVTSSATIPQFPVQDGVTISDHMYRNPRALSLTGRFSLAGKNNSEGNNLYTRAAITSVAKSGEKSWDKWFEEDAGELKDLSADNRLEAVQKVFEYIQAKGILCTVMMCQAQPDGGKTRFKVRDNMALASIRWSEQYNSMSFTLDFTEVITVDALGSFEVLDGSGDYPSLALPPTRSLGEVLHDNGTIYSVVIESLFRGGYIDVADGEAFRLKDEKMAGDVAWAAGHQVLRSTIAYAVAAGIAAAAFGISSAIAAVVGTSATTVAGSVAGGPIGLAIGLAIAGRILLVSAVVAGITAAIRAERLKRGFNLIYNYKDYVNSVTLKPTGADINTATVNEIDLRRLQRLIEDVQYAVDTEVQNLTFYSLPDGESADVAIQVGVDALTARLTPTTESDRRMPFRVELTKGFGDGAESVTGTIISVCGSLYDMQDNDLYRDSSRQYYLYLFNPYYDELFTEGMKPEEVAEAQKKLSNYCFVVARGSVKDSMERLDKTIKSALENAGYRE